MEEMPEGEMKVAASMVAVSIAGSGGSNVKIPVGAMGIFFQIANWKITIF